MSTGFSGNLGFPLPQNWAFDQIANKVIGVGTPGELEIDHNARSGRDPGANRVTKPANVNAAFFAFVDWLRVKAGEWARSHGMSDSEADTLVCHYLREPKYGDAKWSLVAGILNTEFVNEVDKDTTRPRVYFLRDPETGIQINAMHLAASLNAAIYHWPERGSTFGFASVGGWGGDLLTCMADYIKNPQGYTSAYEYGLQFIGHQGSVGTFGEGDLYEDMDAYSIASRLADQDDTRDIAEIIREYYSGDGSSKRFSTFFHGRFGGDADLMRVTAQTGIRGIDVSADVAAYVLVLYAYNGVDPILGLPAPAELQGMARAFAEVVTNRV